MLLILLAGTAVALVLFALLRRLEAGDGPGTRRASEGLARPVGAQMDGGRVCDRRDRRRDRLRRARLAPVLKLRPQLPHQPGPALLRPDQRGPARLLAGRHRRLPRKALARARGRHLPVLLGAPALDSHERDRRPLPLPGGVRRARPPRRHARPRPDRIDPLVRHSRLAGGSRASARDVCGALRGDARLRDRGRLRLVLGDRRAGRRLLPRRRRARCCSLCADRRAGGRTGWAGTELRRRRRGRRRRLARGDRPGRAAPGRTRDRIQPARRRRRRHHERRRPRRHRPLDRALGGLALPAARPDRRARGRIRPRRSTTQPGDRTRGRELGTVTPCARGSRPRAATLPPPTPTSKRRANSTRWPRS